MSYKAVFCLQCFFYMHSEELINEAVQDETDLVVNGVIINNIRFVDDTVL